MGSTVQLGVVSAYLLMAMRADVAAAAAKMTEETTSPAAAAAAAAEDGRGRGRYR
jgi:hypothetical protein